MTQKADAVFEKLRNVARQAAQRTGVLLENMTHYITPNISAKDRKHFSKTFNLSDSDPFEQNRKRYGHMQGTDILINLSQIIEGRGEGMRELSIVCTHGWGFQYGAMLVRC